MRDSENRLVVEKLEGGVAEELVDDEAEAVEAVEDEPMDEAPVDEELVDDEPLDEELSAFEAPTVLKGNTKPRSKPTMGALDRLMMRLVI